MFSGMAQRQKKGSRAPCGALSGEDTGVMSGSGCRGTEGQWRKAVNNTGRQRGACHSLQFLQCPASSLEIKHTP